MRQIPSFSRVSRPFPPQTTQYRRTIERGTPQCMACRDNGTIEIHPELIGEHSPRGVRADLKAGNLSFCACPMGEFWRVVIDDSPARPKQ